MPVKIKAMIVVLALAAITFAVCKRIFLRFTNERDFNLRRNVWFVLNLAAFLAPNFWIFALVAVPLLFWGGRRDSNPVAFYLLQFAVVPSIPVAIPTAGVVNEFFDLDILRMLAICVLIPAWWQARKARNEGPPEKRYGGPRAMDWALLAYGALCTLLYVPPDLRNHVILKNSATNDLRDAFLFFVDAYVVYYVVSRCIRSRAAFIDAIAAFCVGCLILAPQGVFETARHWVLYNDVMTLWGKGVYPIGIYSFRAGLLRATVTTGGPLLLGYSLAIALGFWLYLQARITSLFVRIAVPVVLCAALLATYARGPWMGTLLIYFIWSILGPRALPRLLKATAVAALGLAVLLALPIGGRIIAGLPILGGSVATGSITYRERLFDRAWTLFEEHPILGDQDAYQEMEDLRQGQGIIDLVNSYAQIALFYGVVGLSLFLAFILIAVTRTYSTARMFFESDSAFANLGLLTVACTLGTLVMMGTSSFILIYEKMFYVLAGFAAAYVSMGRFVKDEPG